MNKSQRLLQIARYQGVVKIVFERWIKRIEFDDLSNRYCVTVKYTITTSKNNMAFGYGDTVLAAARDAWKKSAREYKRRTRWHRGRDIEEFKFAEESDNRNKFEHNGHMLTLRKNAMYHCSICQQLFSDKPRQQCPGCEAFPGLWDDAFAAAAKKLGFMPLTKRQMSEAGFQTGKKLADPVAAFNYSKAKSGYLFAYNPADGVKKKQRTAAQIVGQKKAHKKRYHCDKCECRLDTHEHGNEFCDRCKAIEWARNILADGAYILDSETTGLNYDSEMMELAIIDTNGHVHLDTKIRARNAHLAMNGAYQVHGIHPDSVADAPDFADVYFKIQQIVGDKKLLVYNADYDIGLLDTMCEKRGMPELKFNADCIMEWFAQFVGEWNYRHQSYRWQRLPAGDHSARGDCVAALDVLKMMAASACDNEDYHGD